MDTLPAKAIAPDWSPLEQVAIEALAHSHSPYSNFPVAAALLLEDGSIQTGVNVENGVNGLSICAEQTAITAAVSRGLIRATAPPKAVLVISSSNPPATPCGACRQVLKEFARDLPIRCMSTAPGATPIDTTLQELLPLAFEL